MLGTGWEWAARAACKGEALGIFYPGNDDWAPAAAICAGCPVRPDCLARTLMLEYGLGLTSRYGMTGGWTPAERWQAEQDWRARNAAAE